MFSPPEVYYVHPEYMPYTSSVPVIWSQPPPPPRQRHLGRAEIVAAAMALADEAGAGGLTMKAVAARLGPYSPMALYRYVMSKEGLIDLMLDAASAQIPLPEPGPDWRADLRALALATRAMLKRHPWAAQLAHSRPPAGPNLMRRLDLMLGVLTAHGADIGAAMAYAALLDRHILGSALQEIQEAEATAGLDFLAALAPIHELAVGGRFDHLARWLAAPTGPTPDEQFALGLDFLLDGIASRLRPTAAPRRRPAARPAATR